MRKRVSTLTGIIIIVAAAALAFGGVVYFLKSQAPMTNVQLNPSVQSEKISVQDAINLVRNLPEVKIG